MTGELACQELVRMDLDGTVAVVTVGSGRRRNALTTSGWSQLELIVRRVAQEPAVRAVLLRGAGDTFCSGSDMTEWLGAPPDVIDRCFAQMESTFRAIEESAIPFVAEIRGVAAGAGCQLALACDLRVIADSARIGMPIARLAILPSPAFAGRLAAVAGPALARELLYTGRLLDARSAAAAGLVNAAVPGDALGDHTARLLADITRHNKVAVQAAKQAVTVAAGTPSPRTLGPAVSYEDFQHSVAGFLSVSMESSRTGPRLDCADVVPGVGNGLRQ